MQVHEHYQKVNEARRTRALLDEVAVLLAEKDSSKVNNFVLEPEASTLLVDHANELTMSILDEAAILAKHRNAVEIDVSDIYLVLSKKYPSINLPDAPRLVLHRETIGPTQSRTYIAEGQRSLETGGSGDVIGADGGTKKKRKKGE